MPVDKLSIQDFAAKVKAKYPEYKDVNDTLLTQKIIEKHPEYKDMVHYEVANAPAQTPTATTPSISKSAIQDIRHSNEMANRTVSPDQQMITDPNTGMPVENTELEKENKDYKLQYHKQLKELGERLGFTPENTDAVLKDFPDESDENRLSEKLNLKIDNPEKYERLKTADANVHAINNSSNKDAIEYNHLQGDEKNPIENLSHLTRNIQRQREIIYSNLSGEERGKALMNLERNRAFSFNASNPEIQNEYNSNEGLRDKMNVTQYAGLKHLQAFDPEKAKLYESLLEKGDAGQNATIQQKIGLEKVNRDLLNIGRRNTERFINEQQYELDKAYKNAPTQEEKDKISQQFLYNKNIIDGISRDQEQDAARFPYLKDLEFDRQAAELSGDAEKGVLDYTLSKFGRGIGSAGKSIQNIETNLLGSDEDVSNLNLQRLGEGEQENMDFYLPEKYKSQGSPFIYKFDKGLQDAATKIKNDKTISDEQKKQKLLELVKGNQDQVHYVTNTENFGKSANFFSKATLYKNAGMIGDLASIAVQQAGLSEAGAAKFISTTVPMYLSTQNEFYKQALEEGRNNPMTYANTHAAIMMAAGLVNPDLNIAKRAFGQNTAIGKTLAGVSEETWKDVVSKNPAILNRLKNSLTGVGKEAAKIGLTYGAGTSIAKDLADRGLFNKNVSGEQIIDNALKATKDATIGSVALLGLHAITNFKTVSPEEKARVWDLGYNSKLSIEQIDEAVKKGEISTAVGEQRKQVVKTVSKLVESVPTTDAKGNPLTDQQRANYLYNQLIKKKIDEIKDDLPDAQKEKLEAIKTGADIDNNAILDPKTERENLMQRKRELTEELKPGEDGSVNLTPLEKKNKEAELEQINGKIDELDNPKKSAVSVILPEQIKRPETITIKPEENAIQERRPAEVLQREQGETGIGGGERERMEPIQQGNEPAGTRIEKEGEDKGQEKVDEDWPFVEEPGDNDVTSIKNAVTEGKIKEYGLTPAMKEAKRAFPEVWNEAVKKIKKGFDPQYLVDQLKKKARPLTDTEDAILLYHQASKEAELQSINKQINETYEKGTREDFEELSIRKAKILDDLQDIYDVDKKVGTANARGLNARKMMLDRRFSLVNMMAEKRAAEGGRPLTEQEQADIEKRFTDLKEANAAIEKRVSELEAENSALKNKATPEPEEVKEKKVSRPKKDYKSERKQIIKDIRDDLLKAAKGGEGLTSSIPLAAQLKAIAPHVPKLVKNLVESGIDTLEGVTKEILDLLKPTIPELTENHVHDLIAGEFKEAVKVVKEPSKTAQIKKQAKEIRYAVTDPKLLKLRADYERKKAAWGDDLRKAELAKRTKFEKASDTFVKWERAFKLSGITTLAKLMMAGTTRLVSTPLEEVVGGGIYKVLPKGVTSKATGEAGLNVKAEAESITRAFSQGLKDSWDILRKKTRGQSDIEAVFGKNNELPPEAIGFFGQLHSAIKAPVKRAAFERSFRKRIEANIKNGVDVTDPMVQTRIAVQAYKDGQRAIFMQDNIVTDAYKRAINSLEKNKTSPVIGKAFATGLQWLIPFVKVPTNIIGEVQRHGTGLFEGAARLGYQAMKNGLKDVSEDEADAILRAFKKGSIGAGALLLGYFNPNSFGGFYQKGEKQTPDKLKPGSAKVLGMTIPVWLLESPLFQTMQLGATVRKLNDAKLSKSPHNIVTAAGMAELDLMGHEPLVEQPARVTEMITSPKEREYFLGELVKGSIIPAGLSNIAQFTDPATGRKPEGIMQHIETGIPGLRETVPEKSKKKGHHK